MNISVEGNFIVQHAQINIGMAVALPNGNLIVPVIHEVDKLTLVELTQKVNDLSNRARLNKLKPADLEGGTFSISNIGSFGNLMGTPIIVQPQVGILAFGLIEKNHRSFQGLREIQFRYVKKCLFHIPTIIGSSMVPWVEDF